MDVVDFEPRLYQTAAELQCRQYEALHRAGLTVPPRFRDRERALEAVSAPRGSGPAVAALDGDRLIGFLRADGAGALIRMQHRAVEPDRARDTIRALYGAVAGELARRGALRHQVDVLADDGEEVAAWFQLGFGLDQIKGLRGLGSEPVRAPSGVGLRAGHGGDVDALAELNAELQSYHQGSPILRRTDYPRERAVADLRRSIADDTSALFVAEAAGQVIGFVEGEFDQTFEDTVTIYDACTSAAHRGRGVGRALVALVDAWAVERGCSFLGVSWASPNLVSDPFWRGLGFRPVRYRLARDLHDPPLR